MVYVENLESFFNFNSFFWIMCSKVIFVFSHFELNLFTCMLLGQKFKFYFQREFPSFLLKIFLKYRSIIGGFNIALTKITSFSSC